MTSPTQPFPPGLLITDELRRRPSRPPRHEDESRALVALAARLAEAPRSVLQALAEFALELTAADSAGITLAEGDILRWHATAGHHAPRLREGMGSSGSQRRST